MQNLRSKKTSQIRQYSFIEEKVTMDRITSPADIIPVAIAKYTKKNWWKIKKAAIDKLKKKLKKDKSDEDE